MSRGKNPDPQKRKVKHPHATNLQVKAGQKFGAYKAGELYGCYGHRTHAHQPCLFEITEGEMQCPYCAAGHDAVWRGYVPLWDQDFTLRYVLINEEYFVTTDVIPPREQVIVLRGKDPKSPLVVREEKVFTRELPARSPWDRPVNMLGVCLTLWKNEELRKWFRVNKPAELLEDKPVVVLKPAVEMRRGNQPKLNARDVEESVSAVELAKRTNEAFTDSVRNAHKATNGKPGSH